jgi:hypothetical protein
MALCPSSADPVVTANDVLDLYTSITLDGDYTVAGCGTRNNGTGTINVKDIPPGTTIDSAYFIYNTYVSNNIDTPTVLLNGSDASGVLYGICGSTCWVNPGPELTTYLRNRVYIEDVGPSGLDLINGNGKYTVSDLPTDPSMRIGTDGDRVPGCSCSQGAVLVIVWKWNDDAGPLPGTPERERKVQIHVGAKLIATPTGIWGGSTDYAYNFDPGNYKGNSKIVLAAGDTQNSIIGDSIELNGVRLAPPNNAFIKTGKSISVRNLSAVNLYSGASNNLAYVKTTNDCICWFLFVISGDQTSPASRFQPVSCAAQLLDDSITAGDLTLNIHSNLNEVPPWTADGDIPNCYAVVGGGFPPPPFYVSIDKEIIEVTGKGGANPQDQTTWTIVRAQGGTTAASHAIKSCVRMAMPIQSKQAMQAALNQRRQASQRPQPGQV